MEFFTALYKKPIKTFLLVKVHTLINMIYWLAFIHMNSLTSTILPLWELCVPALPLTSALALVWSDGELVQDAKEKVERRKVFLFCRVLVLRLASRIGLPYSQLGTYASTKKRGWVPGGGLGLGQWGGRTATSHSSCLLDWFGGTVKQHLCVQPFSWHLLTTITFSITFT